MRSLIIYSLVFISFCTYGQDRSPEFHDDKEGFNNLKDKTLRSELAYFTDFGANEKKATIKLIEIPLTKYSANYSQFETDSILFKLTKGVFKKSLHKINYVDEYADKIDNKLFWGKDGELPTEQINSIQVIIGKDTIKIPKSAYNDLYEPHLTSKNGNETVGFLRIYASRDRSRYYIYMLNGDGAGAYEATIMIRNKRYIGRVVDGAF